jgi:hypothetical protein
MICSELTFKIMWCIGLFVVGEDFVQSTLPSFVAVVSMTTLKTLEFRL